MEYIRNLSFKGIGIGLLIGYMLPMLILKLLSIFLYRNEITNLYGMPGLIFLLIPLVASPLLASYLSAKHSTKSPLLNGITATLLGILFIISVGELNGITIYVLFIAISISLGIVGAKRHISHG